MADPARAAVLPDDVLQEEVLHRLAPRALAVSRCVCKAWRAVIDARRLLRSDHLPLWPCGVFLNLGHDPQPPMFFAPPYVGRKVASKLDRYVGNDRFSRTPSILDCCNGLLLVAGRGLYVVNPATRRWARLPPCLLPSTSSTDYLHCIHLLFDPTLSPHYQVVMIQGPDEGTSDGGLSEWPPSPCVMWVYSSTTGRWDKRWFAREGGAAGTLAQVQSAGEPYYGRHAVCCHGALYVHCKGDFIMRITLSNCKYQVFRPPEGWNNASVHNDLHLAKSKNGVCLASMCGGNGHLRAWFLNESASGKAESEWVLKYDVNLRPVDSHFCSRNGDRPINSQWILHRHDYNKGNNATVRSKKKFQWDFDNGSMVKINATDDEKSEVWIWKTILGFHPYKEVAFLHLKNDRVVACHLDGSKFQDLGHLALPRFSSHSAVNAFFVYSPCWMGELSEHN